MGIDQELAPMAAYLKGRVLNAGCGDRDIRGLLKNWHASSVDNCDIEVFHQLSQRSCIHSMACPSDRLV
jgi:hypothetical protein